jgi:hypothetical protein
LTYSRKGKPLRGTLFRMAGPLKSVGCLPFTVLYSLGTCAPWRLCQQDACAEAFGDIDESWRWAVEGAGPGRAGRDPAGPAAACVRASRPPRIPTLDSTRLRGHVETLASPAFAGRRPGTEGETQTLRYLVRQWFEMGLESGTNLPGSPWFAPVELVAREPVLSRATFLRGRRRVVADEHDVFVVTSGPRNLVESAPVLFVGHGVVPSRTELAGRVALLLEGPRRRRRQPAAGRGGRQGWSGAEERRTRRPRRRAGGCSMVAPWR